MSGDKAFATGKSVLETDEFRRILALPRLKMSDAEVAKLVEDMTAVLKTGRGTWKLRAIQARALHAVGVYGGLFGPMRVGAGKTLTSLMAPYILDAKKPVLLLPASLIEKTRDEQRQLSQHWLIPRNIRTLSYQMLGREGSAKLLHDFKPDLIIADECQKLKNRKAAVTRRVERYMKDFPETKFVAISGSIMKSSISDFAHIIAWCLKEGVPVPRVRAEVDEWADALDEKLENPFARISPGPLLKFATADDYADATDEAQVARRGFRRRLVDTPGLVATQNEQVDCKLRVTAIELPCEPETEENFKKLRTEMRTPDDWDLMMAAEAWRVANELSIGLHYVWSPRPPDEWRNARRDWAAYVREVLSHSHTIDSELQVRKEVLSGKRPDGAEFLRAWQKQEPTFTINSKAVWHDETMLDACAAWMKKAPGIVWTQHTFFAEALSRATGAAYFGTQGEDRKGRRIDKIDVVNPTTDPMGVIASIPANGEGRNLQLWNRNLLTFVPPGAQTWEQLLGRTHRDGQEAGLVTADVMIGCKEHFAAWMSALRGAQAALDTTGLSQKLLICDVVGFPDEDEIAERSGWRWGNDPDK